MTLTGPVTGTGSLTKTGAGTIIFSSQTSNFSGPTTVSSGTLSLAYDTLFTPRVPRINSSTATITLGAGSGLVFTGPGNLVGSPLVILKASGGVTGTFASVTGLPAGFTLDYTYDDDGNAATPAVVAIINPSAPNPFASWIQAYVGNGKVPTDDPDGIILSRAFIHATAGSYSEKRNKYTTIFLRGFVTGSNFGHLHLTTL